MTRLTVSNCLAAAAPTKFAVSSFSGVDTTTGWAASNFQGCRNEQLDWANFLEDAICITNAAEETEGASNSAFATPSLSKASVYCTAATREGYAEVVDISSDAMRDWFAKCPNPCYRYAGTELRRATRRSWLFFFFSSDTMPDCFAKCPNT